MPGIDAPPPTTLAGVCTPWATRADLPGDVGDADRAKLDVMLRMASDVLYDLTGRRWPGVCVDVVRPIAQRRVENLPSWMNDSWWPTIGSTGQALRGSWGYCSCNRSRMTGCTRLSEIELTHDVLDVLEVKVDGVVVPAAEYRVDEHRYLVALTQTNGELRTWPCCQHDELPDTAVGTWSVTFSHGNMPPVGGVIASASLAYELGKATNVIAGTGCRLSRRVQNVTRQGVTAGSLPVTLFAEGRTGLEEVDLWLASVNMGRRRGRMISVQRTRRFRRV